MKKEDKIIAFYLPQFHEIPENNMFWGKGFTEWDNVRTAKKLYKDHNQPRIPLNENYYNLKDVNVMRWQAQIAKEHGLHAFCFYHYWFKNNPVMDIPLINYRNETDIDFPYCLCWANESWNNGWAKADQKVILKQEYGDETEWENHFQFFLDFFKDSRYLKENNKPILVIYRPYSCTYMLDVLNYWKKRAIENGFDGIVYFSQRFEDRRDSDLYNFFDYHIEYQPGFVWGKNEYPENRLSVFERLHDHILRKFNIDIPFLKNGPRFRDYDQVWSRILELKPESVKSVAGAFVDWDNSPRHKERGLICKGANPEKFEIYIKKQISHMHEVYSSNYLFIFAWNEWGEGGYLEPDILNNYGYLKALKKAVLAGDHCD